MMGERRAPAVQHSGDTDPCAEALGIGGDGERRLGRRLGALAAFCPACEIED